MIGSRHDRQRILPEIGEVGQARLASGRATVDGVGVSGEIEALYLAGAGVGRIVVTNAATADAARAIDPEARVDVDPHARSTRDHEAQAPFTVRDGAARDVALGAWRALDTIRRLLAKDAS